MLSCSPCLLCRLLSEIFLQGVGIAMLASANAKRVKQASRQVAKPRQLRKLAGRALASEGARLQRLARNEAYGALLDDRQIGFRRLAPEIIGKGSAEIAIAASGAGATVEPYNELTTIADLAHLARVSRR
jgi:hypothetical protein